MKPSAIETKTLTKRLETLMNNKLWITFNKDKSIYQQNFLQMVSFQKVGMVYKTLLQIIENPKIIYYFTKQMK